MMEFFESNKQMFTVLSIIILLLILSYGLNNFEEQNDDNCEILCDEKSIQHLVYFEPKEELCLCYYATGEFNSIIVVYNSLGEKR